MPTVVINKHQVRIPEERENTVEIYDDSDILLARITLVPSGLLSIVNDFIHKRIGFQKLKSEVDKWNTKTVEDTSQ